MSDEPSAIMRREVVRLWNTERAKTLDAWLAVLMQRDGATDPMDYCLVEQADLNGGHIRWWVERRPKP